MALDDALLFKPALSRLLARCPPLKSNPRLFFLSQTDTLLEEDEIVNSVAELFLHPNYTIPILGCFRNLILKIVNKAIELLRLVPDLKSSANDGKFIGDIGEEDWYVIDFYVRSGRGLKLHESAVLALGRTLDLAPFTLRSLLSYFSFAPPPFQRLLQTVPDSPMAKKDIPYFLVVVRACYRFITLEPKVFSELWNWSCFLDLVHWSTGFDTGEVSALLENILDIRWCSIQLVSVTLKMSDRATKNLGLKEDEALACLYRWEEFCQDVSIEKAGWYLEPTEIETGTCSIDSIRRIDWEAKRYFNPSSSPFVPTSAVKKSFDMAMLAVRQKWPILLQGPIGSGKTALINKLAEVRGTTDVLFIHMDDQLDSKTLIGSYVCTENPGEFKWQPGSLTQAVLKGFWIVFEDIDKAPSEVLSCLAPLLEGANLYVAGSWEVISAAEGFRLFATISSSKRDLGRSSISPLWRKVMIGAPSNIDLLAIVTAWYSDLEPLAQKLIDTMERVNTVTAQRTGGFQIGRSGSVKVSNRFSSRDLLRWCKRIIGLNLNIYGHSLSLSQRKCIYHEAVDIFVASLASSQNRLLLMKEIASIWAVPVSDTENLPSPTQPQIISSARIGNGESLLQVGRVLLEGSQQLDDRGLAFVNICSSLRVLERVACSVKYNEPVLLVGETGTGKTTLVQYLARMLGKPLTVLNMSQQSDAADLLGGFKPTDASLIFIPLLKEFYELLPTISNRKENSKFLDSVNRSAKAKNWKILLKAFQKAVEAYRIQCRKSDESGYCRKRKRTLSKEIMERWDSFSLKIEIARKQTIGMSFTFVEGAFVKALRNGHWILLDEVNLAPPETLQRVTGVLDGEKGTLCLAERGDVDYINRHSEFRIFACMNPATDAGKRDLPFSARSRFTEYFVDDVLDDEDLFRFVMRYMDDLPMAEVKGIVRFYKAAKRESEERLLDGANQKPRFSLRSLARALEYTRKARQKFGHRKALYDGLCMFFLTLLDISSAKIMKNMILSDLFAGTAPQDVTFDAYFTEKELPQMSEEAKSFHDNYVLTKSVKEHLKTLSRELFMRQYPVLLQGPTSSGKTSLVQYLAGLNGRKFVRINNHEHTDLQEYFGSYIIDSSGKLTFQEGILVEAVRNGYWIVLDELNLAPSDVLEALNRLLDDNRELFLPELQETVIPHPNFMLFATQNPPTYSGRKVLSRAFRNRFLEIYVDDIPEDELSTILEKRCKIPRSYATKMVEVMKDLQLHRQCSKVFAGKHGFITPRDLFRWADRFRVLGGKSYEDLALDGYFLLAERLRDGSEKGVVQKILKGRLGVEITPDELYVQKSAWLGAELEHLSSSGELQNLGKIIPSKSLGRLFFLVERCYHLRQPVLLVGETGGGKTTVCQLLSIYLRSRLHILNCHQYTEASDFLGGFYPVRERARLAAEFRSEIEQVKSSNIFLQSGEHNTMSSDIEDAASTLNGLDYIIRIYSEKPPSHGDTTKDLDTLKKVRRVLMELHMKWQTLFSWQDGPLVQAMKNGDLFLVDEISLADDSILERLNSVLEPSRKLALAEKGGHVKSGSVLEEITAEPNFFLMATMNPGGDFGKRELSPALRNRFTEIWVPPVSDLTELRSIATERFCNSELVRFVDPLLKFWEWFHQLQTGKTLTVRDLLSWIDFVNATEKSLGSNSAFIHGAFLVLLDGLSLGTGMSRSVAGKLRERCFSFLLEQLELSTTGLEAKEIFEVEKYGWGNAATHMDMNSSNVVEHDQVFGIHPFCIVKGGNGSRHEGFQLSAPTTRKNALRVLRAMQLRKPVLLEGSPGVGKTSLVSALGNLSGHSVVRINLSEQTDIMDLLGSDLPVEGETGVEFAWSDGILLQALKNGCWVILDELNLAPQSVLEGLNAILDHRAEVYIPELGHTFRCPPSFRVFACQNPSSQGGGRKGLPKSFLNRFTKVYVDELHEEDYLFICTSLFPSLPKPLLLKLICFNNRLHEDTMSDCKYGQNGSPWEFNLRDIIRSCQIIESAPVRLREDCFLNIIYVQRMRTFMDRREVLKLYEDVFGMKPCISDYPKFQIDPEYLTVGNAFVRRNHFQHCKISESQLHLLRGMGQSLEAALTCVRNGWLCILVGPSASGKTSLIRLLAELTGNTLNEFHLSPGTDISELLGCFEQYDVFRNFRAAIRQVKNYINEYYSVFLESSPETVMIERKGLIKSWFTFLADKKSMLSFDSSFGECWRSGSSNLFGPLVKIVEQMKLDISSYQLNVSWSERELNDTLNTIINLQKNQKTNSFSGKFEWVTGGLVKAIEHGEWVVLENANVCNPTVLDRINSLVEQGGSITINECGLVNGKPLVLTAHPKFRLFLTVNPSQGEVSRAMRNRGVELFMLQPECLSGEVFSGEKNDIRDVKRFLVLSGIPDCKLVDAMAEAHISAKDACALSGITISLLELARWVNLFQQFLMNGNLPTQSLQLSWEHVYLSSLGETNLDVVLQPKDLYLSGIKSSNLDPLPGCSLSLPGGWPTPLNLRSITWYSREASVKQNCMYLEFLGAQFASYLLGISMKYTPSNYKNLPSQIIPKQILHRILFPTTSGHQSSKYSIFHKFDLVLADKVLLFAANWTIEQATETDLNSYIIWFKWHGSRLQPYCNFFKRFLSILEQERQHPIWNHLVESWREISNHLEVNKYLRPLPLLSLKLVELAIPVSSLEACRKRLYNAIHCVGLLRLSFEQWSVEDEFSASFLTRNPDSLLGKFHFWIIPILNALRQLEKEVLCVIVTSTHFDLLLQLYPKLLEFHASFWTSVTSSQSKYLSISWHSLKKEAIKLREFCPVAVEIVRDECLKLDESPIWKFNPTKPMLWKNGGHPFYPSSAAIYSQMNKLTSFCDAIWPVSVILKNQPCFDEDWTIVAAVSADTEFRSLAMQGICMSSYVISIGGQDDAEIVHQLEEIYQTLLSRFNLEKESMKGVLVSTVKTLDSNLVKKPASVCCSFHSEILCRKPGLDCWLETLPLVDSKSLSLDIYLLEELSKILLLDGEEQHTGFLQTTELLEYGMNFSLKFSSRPPSDFSPHQKILWVLDAWSSVDSVSRKLVTFILELWHKWHTSLWTHSQKKLSTYSQGHCHDISVAGILFKAIKTVTVNQILDSAVPIRDYAVRGLQLRVASGQLWRDAPPGRDIPSLLFSAACTLFEQIIFAHRKSFEVDRFAEIKSIFSSIHRDLNVQEKDQLLDSLILLVRSSSHGGLTSLTDSLIKPVLNELYLECPSRDCLFKLGCAWLHIGALCFYLLTNSNDPDPAMKYTYKDSQLAEKIALLELEIKVRRESDHLAGSCSSGDDERQRLYLLKDLEMERKRIHTKVAFRPDPDRFEGLKSELVDFQKLVASSAVLARDLKCEQKNSEMTISQTWNWQETASSFIHRLSKEYAAYADIIQPVQVAIYEMKLGLSLLVSSALQNIFLNKIGEDNIAQIDRTLSMVMRFPRLCGTEFVTVRLETMQPEFLSSHLDVCRKNQDLLKKLYVISGDFTSDKEVSILQRDASIYQYSLLWVVHYVYSSLVMDNASMKLLHEIFGLFANLWLEMKVQTKEKDIDKAQPYKFRPHAFRIEGIFEIDISTFRNMALDDGEPLDWQDMLLDPESTDEGPARMESQQLEVGWNLIEDSLLENMVHIHNQLFGSNSNVGLASDEDKLQGFVIGYKLGCSIIKDLENMLPSTLDANLSPECLLRLSLDYETIFGPHHQSARLYNFYKDTNAPEMAQMVQPLVTLQERVVYLLNEFSESEHPDLRRISEIIETLLATPLDAPLAKVLFGLQFLLGRGRLWNDNASKSSSLSDQLQPISNLASSWFGIELDCWPAFLNGVKEQYEINAGKLWFPLHSILHREHPGDVFSDNRSTIQSLEEFIMQTSSAGEFKKRLELLLAFHGQLKNSISSKSDTRPHLIENVRILYNVYGYYIQFLPLITEHIEAGRRSIEKDLHEHVKLSKWKFRSLYMSMDATKGTRQKFWKLIRKFNDTLQVPVEIILKQKATKMIPDAVDLAQLSDTERFDWRKKMNSAVQELCSGRKLKFDLPSICSMNIQDYPEKLPSCIELAITFTHSLSSGYAYRTYHERWRKGWESLERICITAADLVNLVKHGSKNLRKRRTLTNLLKLLESCGLSRHMIPEGELEAKQPSHQFLQPSYDIHHLLELEKSKCPRNDNNSTKCPNEISDLNWELANQTYFRNMAIMQQLEQARLSSHKDLSLEQVKRSTASLRHLMIIQRDQRSAAYSLAKKLQKLRKLTSPLMDFDHDTSSECFITPNQYATIKCMWKQKQLFDSIYCTSKDTSLFLRKVENTHLHICDNVRCEAKRFSLIIDKFIPLFRQSKELLDGYLLGDSGIVAADVACKRPFVVSKQMEKLVTKNSILMNDFEEDLRIFCQDALREKTAKDYFLNQFKDMIDKAKEIIAEFNDSLEPENDLKSSCTDVLSLSDIFSRLNTSFLEAFNKTIKEIMSAYEKQNTLSNAFPEDLLTGNIAAWENLFKVCIENLLLDNIIDSLEATIFAARKLVNDIGNKQPDICAAVEMYLNHLRMLLEIILIIGDVILSEFLSMHRTVAEMTSMLANIFTSLYFEGLGAAEEDQKDSAHGDKFQDASGTGMGEGEGLKDVSDEIDDESQLLDLSEKQTEKPDASNEASNNKDKGIEMEQEFSGDTFDVDEGSGEESDDNDEDLNLESAMGETGDANEVVDEKHWDEESKPDNPVEKYESGPSVKETDSSSRELRAKQDGDDDLMDESGGLENNGSDETPCEEEQQNPDGADDDDSNKDLKMEKEAAYGDPSELDLGEPDLDLENMSIDEADNMLDGMEEVDPEGSAEDGEGKTDPEGSARDKELAEESCEQVDGNSTVNGEAGTDLEQDTAEMDCMEETSKDAAEQRNQDSLDYSMQSIGSANRFTDPASASNLASENHQVNNACEVQTGLAPSQGLFSNGVSEMELILPNLSNEGKETLGQPEVSPDPSASSLQRTQANPYRSVGDALKEWKERAKISNDSEGQKPESLDGLENENAEEYRFVSDAEKSTTQALGSATSDQIDQNIDGNKFDAEKGSNEDTVHDEMEIDKENNDKYIKKCSVASTLNQRSNEQMSDTLAPDVEAVKGMDESLEVEEDHLGDQSGGLVSIQSSYRNNDTLQVGNLSITDEELREARKNIEEISEDVAHNATVLWTKYEQITTRLSQELAEQLRLVMEPTLASKLQGDYRTGKRINMKKVIPYIASHFRKDKIWLRRTKPNKRDYQVVVAVDDSLSMSENNCGRVAIESLVTVCRAMSQLEVGQLAVASFGGKRNIRLLKDFDQPFTSEAGVEMISSMTFKQDNSIADEPMVDLLKYLNSMLDAAVASARVPSGQNPLEQLVLIIGDGRFPEKEKLKRLVRDVLNRKRLIAFLLLDRPEDSIMTHTEASFEGQSLTFPKYLNTFPFPYYIVLENIEALPRTLADLLRQWFELMQNAYGE